MRRLIINLAITGMLLALSGSVQAQVVIRTKEVDDQRITTLKPVAPPEVIGKEFDDAKAKGVVLNANDWSCGYQFTDQKNRRWKRALGPALNEKPNNVPGWLIQTEEGKMYFMSTSGTLFCLSGIIAAKAE